MNKAAIIGLSVAAVGAVALMGWLLQKRMTLTLPPLTEFATIDEARVAAYRALLDTKDGFVLPIAGTGSMQPFIPKAPAGSDPKTTIVAYAIISGHYEDVTKGDLCLYLAHWAGDISVIHQAAEHDSLGWIMSGLNNARFETWERMTEANFKGIARHVFTVRVSPAPDR